MFIEQQVGMIAISYLGRVIGYDRNMLFFNHHAYWDRFSEVTDDSILIMGNRTFNLIPKKILHKKPKHVLSRHAQGYYPDTQWFGDFNDALLACPVDAKIWIVGGLEIFNLALPLRIPDFVDLTIVERTYIPPMQDPPITIKQKVERLDAIPLDYSIDFEYENPEDETLLHRRYFLRKKKGTKSFINELREKVSG